MSKRLPRPDELVVESRKLTDYLLCESHPDGASKAKFFVGVGFDVDDAGVLGEALTQHGRTRDVVEASATGFGMKYVVQCSLITPDERNPCIRSIWIAEGSEAPRLVTAYPNGDEKFRA